MNTRHHTLYRSRRGKIFGVIQGISDYTGLNAFWMRVILILLAIFTWFLPMLLTYVVAALLMKLEPAEELAPDDEEFYNSVADNQTLATERIKRRMEALDRRAKRLESIVTARGYDWDRRMNNPQ